MYRRSSNYARKASGHDKVQRAHTARARRGDRKANENTPRN